MVGRVGGDVFGAQLCESLRAAGVDTAPVRVTEGSPTGVALIFVEDGGQNEIVVASGANACLTPEDVRREIRGSPGGLLLLQLESPLETVEEAAAARREARDEGGPRPRAGPPPARRAPPERGLSSPPTRARPSSLLGRSAGEVPLAEAPEIARRAPRARGAVGDPEARRQGGLPRRREGGAPLPGARRSRRSTRPPPATRSTAPSRSALAEDRDLAGAIAFANAAAALSVTRLGAQASIPTRAEVEGVPVRSGREGSEDR